MNESKNNASAIDGTTTTAAGYYKYDQSGRLVLTPSNNDFEVTLENAVERFEEKARIDFEEVTLPRYLEAEEEKLDDQDCACEQLSALENEARQEFEDTKLPKMIESFEQAFAKNWHTES